METTTDTLLSLDEIRQNIDRIDCQLVRLIAERSTFVTKASVFKKTTIEAADTARVEAVINKVRAFAEEYDMDKNIIEKIYRTMISSFVQEEISKITPLYQQLKKSYY